MKQKLELKKLMLLCLVVALLNCEKRPKTGTDLGDESKLDVVIANLANAQKGVDRQDIKKTERALFHRALYVATAPRSVQATVEKTGFDRQEDEELIRIEMTQDTHSFSNQQTTDVFQHFIWFFEKHPEPSQDSFALPGVTFHNLEVNINNDSEPPQQVKATADCRQTPNCKIQAHKVAFDQLSWSGDQYRKVRNEFVFSNTVPAIANPIRSCQSGTFMVPREEGSSVKIPVFVHYCSELMDYIYASPSNSSTLMKARTADTPTTNSYLVQAALAAWQEQALKDKATMPTLFQTLTFDQLYTPTSNSGIKTTRR